MPTDAIKRKIAKTRIPVLCGIARAVFAVDDAPDDDGNFWLRNKPNCTASGYKTIEKAQEAREIRVAFKVLDDARIEDANEYDWHLWTDSAEHIVEEIVSRDYERRIAQRDLGGFHAIANALANNANAKGEN